MNKLKVIENMGLKITWKLLSIGLYGCDMIPVQITRAELFEYLDGQLTTMDERTDKIISLMCEQDNEFQTDRLLRSFSDNDESVTAVQLRKWRACMLHGLLCNVNQDCLQGLLELMEFWLSMGMPRDCPLDFPSSDGELSVQNYFTQSVYKDMISKNNNWLNQEISRLIALER